MNEALAAEVERARFTPVRLREGYDMGEVDQFLDDLCVQLRAGGSVDALIAGARFTPVRLREGYEMADVDRLLQRVADQAVTADGVDGVGGDRGADADAVGASPAPDWVNPVSEVTSPLARLLGRLRRR